MVHNDHDSLFHYFDKHNRYSDWEASLRVKGLMNDPREANLGGRALLKRLFHALPFKAPISFLHSYVFRLGFLDGKAGFDYAVARAMYYWQIRIKTEESARPDRPAPRMATTRWWRERRNDPRPSVPRGPGARGGCRGCDGCGACLATRRRPAWRAAAAGPVHTGARPARPLRADGAALVAGQGSLFRWSPQFAYGFRRWLLRLFGARVGAKALIRPSATVTYPGKSTSASMPGSATMP